VADYNLPVDLKYTPEHEWVRSQGDLAVVGLTDYAQKQLGDVTYVELPPLGKNVAQMGELAVVESVKAASDVYSPLAGAVAQVNQTLEDQPQLINQDPYGAGWLVKLTGFDSGQLANLLDVAQYQALLDQG
jgi:glycine cleavage system H protein